MNISIVLNHTKVSFGGLFLFLISIKPKIIFISNKVFKVVPSITQKLNGKWQNEKKAIMKWPFTGFET